MPNVYIIYITLNKNVYYIIYYIYATSTGSVGRILAGRNLPRLSSEDSLFFIPSHIRVLYVPHTPIFVAGTLYENLVYGVTLEREDHGMDRVLTICERLQLPPVVLARGTPSIAFKGLD